MDEETKVYDSIEEMEQEELGRLYVELEACKPGSEQYDKILTEICKIRTQFNEGNKIWISKEDLDQRKELEAMRLEDAQKARDDDQAKEENRLKQQKLDTVLRAVGVGVNILTTTLTAWVTLKYNIKLGPISTKDAWTQIFRKK